MMKQKIARLRYDKGDSTKPNTIAEQEGIYFEAWDDEYGWCVIVKAPCRKSVDFPNENEANFIHWEILRTISEYSQAGYTIKYVGDLAE